MKRRDVITLLGFLSLGGFAMLWRNMGSFWRPGPNEHIASTVAAGGTRRTSDRLDCAEKLLTLGLRASDFITLSAALSPFCARDGREMQ